MAFVQAQLATASSGGAITSLATAGLTTTPGNTLVVGFVSAGAIANVTIADSKGNTWTAHPSNPYAPGISRTLYLWTAAGITGGASHTVTISFNSINNNQSLVVEEFSGRAQANVVDVTGFGVDAAATASHSTGSVTSTIASDDLVAWNALNSTAANAIAGSSGWTQPAAGVSNAGAGLPAGMQYQLAVAPGTYTDTWTTSSGGAKGAGLLVALQVPPIPLLPWQNAGAMGALVAQ